MASLDRSPTASSAPSSMPNKTTDNSRSSPGSTLANAANSALAEATGKASDMASDASASVSRMTSGLADSLRDGVETQKNAGADAVASLARSARDAASGMDDTSPQMANLVRASADAVEKASNSFRQQSLGDIMDSAGEFAAKQPVAFFGCGILAGLVISRLFASSNR